MAGLLDFLGNMGATPPSYMEGLLGADQMEKLKGQATSTGLANMVLGYLAAPKNQNLGLGRILGGAVQAGMQGAQGVYSGAMSDYETQQKINEMKKQQEARNVFETESKNVITTTPAQYQTIATSGGYEPQQPSADQLSPNFNLTKLPDVTTQVQTAPATQSLNQDALMKLALSGDPRAKTYVETLQAMKDLNPVAKPRPTEITPNGQLIYKDTGELVTTRNFAAPKEAPSMTEEPNRVAFAMYGKPVNQLTPDEVNKVNNYMEQSKVRVANAGVAKLPKEALGLGTSGANKVDEALLSSGDRLSQLNQIQMNFKPEYLSTPYKTKAAWAGLKDKFNIASPEEQNKLKNYAAFRQDSVRQLNSYINEITGAAIGLGEEADRIKAGVPNVGSGMFDGDSPTEFESKLNNTMKSLRLAEARLAYVKRNGLAITNIKIDEMPSLIAKREKEIINANKLDINKNLTHRQQLKQQLATEFGLVY